MDKPCNDGNEEEMVTKQSIHARNNFMKNTIINNHPIVQDRLTRIRDKNTSNADFRKYLTEIARFLCVDATAKMALKTKTIETPIEKYDGVELSDHHPLIIPILRAGLASLNYAKNILILKCIRHLSTVI